MVFRAFIHLQDSCFSKGQLGHGKARESLSHHRAATAQWLGQHPPSLQQSAASGRS